MAQFTQSLALNVYIVPPEIWTEIFNFLALEDLLSVRASRSSHFKALVDDHPTFCNNIHLPPNGSTVLFHRRCEAGARKGCALSLRVCLRFNDWVACGRVLSSDARSEEVATVVDTLCQFSAIVRSMDVSICDEHFHLLAPYLAQPASLLKFFDLGIVDYDGSQLVRRLPNDLFQGDAPVLHEVQLFCIAPPARTRVTFPSVRLLTATGGIEADFTFPVEHYRVFPYIEVLHIGGEAWFDPIDDDAMKFFDTPKALKHIKLDFDEYGENGRLCQAMPTRNLESLVMTSPAYDDANMRGFLHSLSELRDTVVLTITVQRVGYVGLSFISGGDSAPRRSRTLEVSISYDELAESTNEIKADLVNIFQLVLQASTFDVTVTELHIDVATGPGIISEFIAVLRDITALVLVIHPETEVDQDWLAASDIWSEAEDGMSKVPDPRLRGVRTAKVCSGDGFETEGVELHETDADTLVWLMKRLPKTCTPLEFGACILTAEQRQILNIS